MRRFLAAGAVGGIAVAIMLTGSAASASPSSTASDTAVTAAAADESPCGAPFTHPRSGQTVQFCPDWAPNGAIPVHDGTSPNDEVVGHINPSGDDWYTCQQPGDPYRLGEFENNWYAFTTADNGRPGWVNEVYFRGGDNNERDANLTVCRDF